MCFGYEVIKCCMKSLRRRTGDVSVVGRGTLIEACWWGCGREALQWCETVGMDWRGRLFQTELPERVEAPEWKADGGGWQLTDENMELLFIPASPAEQAGCLLASLDGMLTWLTPISRRVVRVQGKPALWKDHLSSPFKAWHKTDVFSKGEASLVSHAVHFFIVNLRGLTKFPSLFSELHTPNHQMWPTKNTRDVVLFLYLDKAKIL